MIAKIAEIEKQTYRGFRRMNTDQKRLPEMPKLPKIEN